MRLLRIAPFALALVAGLAGPAQAQMPPGFGMPQQQEPPCLKDFVALRDEAQKRAAAIKAGMDKKVPREEACKLFQAFGTAEAKMIKFAEANAMSCGIPPQAIAQMKQGQANAGKIRAQVCAVGAGPAKPAAPSLSDALGTSNAPIPETNKGTGGTFNTLTGNALSR
jgi:hypothetical protein